MRNASFPCVYQYIDASPSSRPVRKRRMAPSFLPLRHCPVKKCSGALAVVSSRFRRGCDVARGTGRRRRAGTALAEAANIRRRLAGRHAHVSEEPVRHVRGDLIPHRSPAVGIGRQDGLDLRTRDAACDEPIEQLTQPDLTTVTRVHVEQYAAVITLTTHHPGALPAISTSHVAPPVMVAYGSCALGPRGGSPHAIRHPTRRGRDARRTLPRALRRVRRRRRGTRALLSRVS